MKTEPKTTHVYSTIGLLDFLLDFKLNSEEYISNESIIKKISIEIDKLEKIQHGNLLFSIIKDKDRTLFLVLKNESQYNIFSWVIKEKIEKKIDVEIHELNESSELSDRLYSFPGYKRELYASACIVPSLNGFNISMKALNGFADFLTCASVIQKPITKAVEELQDVYEIGREISNKLPSISLDAAKIYTNFISKNAKDITINGAMAHSELSTDKRFTVGKLLEIKEVSGARHCKMSIVNCSNKPTLKCETTVYSNCPTSRSRDASVNHYKSISVINSSSYYYTEEVDASFLERVPYNLLDAGRLILGFRDRNDTIFIFSSDPRSDENYLENFKSHVEEYLTKEIVSRLDLSSIHITDGDKHLYFNTYVDQKAEDISIVQRRLKTLRRMIDEYNYIVKKQKAIGTDVSITDKIKYNHSEGKIIYNDFSIAIDDEYIKSMLFEEFNQKLIMYYRDNTRSEQEILDELISNTFKYLASRLESKQIESIDIPININGTISLKITGKPSVRRKKTEDETEGKVLSVGRMYYINDQRFNKNELVIVLKEMICYRDQKQADKFIENVGKLGLSVYIGITTGYEVNFSTRRDEESNINRIFKFKKLTGRSSYQLLLDNTSIPIKGKKLIGLLYEKFIGENPPNFLSKIPTIIHESCQSSLEYLKYKILIDSTYDKYKTNAKEFLNKKVTDLGASHVKYNNQRSRKIMDAIYVTGASGRHYVIAYDFKDSFVFMDPVVDSGENTFKDGKYICMIDQSNIKSNISFDTVVSKLMALKNDSSIAHTIYNLQDEL